jgi:hypothetical protein
MASASPAVVLDADWFSWFFLGPRRGLAFGVEGQHLS